MCYPSQREVSQFVRIPLTCPGNGMLGEAAARLFAVRSRTDCLLMAHRDRQIRKEKLMPSIAFKDERATFKSIPLMSLMYVSVLFQFGLLNASFPYSMKTEVPQFSRHEKGSFFYCRMDQEAAI
ncbi:hypothetical protein JTE90_020534 [Oedothorax gibbosus]|uniref:Uncharacterized protein n=1 Tax=Oedothorax gibbosus TaxID=931172 RepID=A0AAV6VVW7_9ARAC|nr:hypothetical protein JTE90_020534 [Oedothorax gibbosus]